MEEANFKNLISQIVASDELHAKWLNSLSMMENCGARKISASEHSQKVDLIVLKHAAEEARHAYYLKSQIKKTNYQGCKDYHPDELLAPVQSKQYLHELDAAICRYLKSEMSYEGHQLKYAAYLLVTYAIEVRADELYPIYEEVLKEQDSNISVRMIVAEEKGHLEEMIQQMNEFFDQWSSHSDFVLKIEKQLFTHWVRAIEKKVSEYKEVA
ncbi:MAG: hypothetical protein AAGA66_05815 [Bacteroidota bacterium]